MSIFTVVSLVIAMSGATYASIAALRGFFTSHVAEWVQAADTRCERMRQIPCLGGLRWAVERVRNLISGVRYVWHFCNIVPIIGFACLAFWVAFSVCGTPWNTADAEVANLEQQDVVQYQWMLAILLIVDLACILVAVLCIFALIVLNRLQNWFNKTAIEKPLQPIRDKVQEEDAPPF